MEGRAFSPCSLFGWSGETSPAGMSNDRTVKKRGQIRAKNGRHESYA
ncbi:protein of unknown function [Paraburkholderia dioscoreae]|uniref:Uncharacterized protein n=1 Tax=Paraburkholderia dioscoreae TaxID=2604047 RepID=A0A5Q4Z326_9BURK|nr:protein of unknown function [Paraburkholderia dioscoreae]